MSSSAAQQDETVRLIMELIGNACSEERVRQVAAQHNWTLDAILDQLLLTEPDPDARQTTAAHMLDNGFITPTIVSSMRVDFGQFFPTTRVEAIAGVPDQRTPHVRQLDPSQDVVSFLISALSADGTPIIQPTSQPTPTSQPIIQPTPTRQPTPSSQPIIQPTPSSQPTSQPISQPISQEEPVATVVVALTSEQQLLLQRAELQNEAIRLRAQGDSNAPPPPSSGAASAASASPSTEQRPRVGVYYTAASDAATADIIEQLFVEIGGLSKHDIECVDLRANADAADYVARVVAASSPSFAGLSPLVFFDGRPIGDLAAVNDLLSAEHRANFLSVLVAAPSASSLSPAPAAAAATPSNFASLERSSEEETEEDQQHLGIGVVSKLIGAAESVSSWMAAPLSWFAAAPPPLEPGIDFKVIHQNWYCRNLYRTLRFTQSAILRIHPEKQVLRASHPYPTIDAVVAVDDWNIIIKYNDGSAPDYIRASASRILRMKVLLNERSKGRIRIEPSHQASLV